MGRSTGAIVSGLIFGAVAVALMLPMQFPDKRTALLGAFASRFAIGFTIAACNSPGPDGSSALSSNGPTRNALAID